MKNFLSSLDGSYEFSMTNPGALAEYVGFTENEVKELCGQFDMSFEKLDMRVVKRKTPVKMTGVYNVSYYNTFLFYKCAF